MALTGYYKTLIRPRTHRPLSMLKYDPVGRFFFLEGADFVDGLRGNSGRGGARVGDFGFFAWEYMHLYGIAEPCRWE